jgi:hypothetical protein
MAGCSKSFMNLIGGTCSSSDHHQTRQDKTRSGGEIAAQRRLFLIKVAGGKRRNTELDIIGLTYLPEAASTKTTTTTTTRSRLQVCVCVCVCVQTFFFSKTLELCVRDFFYKNMNLREFCTELFLSFFVSFPSRALSKQIKSGY